MHMKTILNLFIISFVVTICYSCSELTDILPESQNDFYETKSVMDTETFTKTIVYKGKVYKSVCESRNDSIYYENKEVERLLNDIYSNPNSVSFVQNEEVTLYFDSQEDFLKKYDITFLPENSINENEPLLRKVQPSGPKYNSIAYAILYDDTKFDDTFIEFSLTEIEDSEPVTQMKDHALNDKVSSLKVQYTYSGVDYKTYCALLTVWEDSNYNSGDHNKTKHRTNFIATHENRYLEVSNLKKVSCWNAHDSWNDRISSLNFHIGIINSLPEVY